MGRSSSVTNVIEEILTEVSGPIHYHELTRLVLERKPIGGKTPHKTVMGRLSTNPKFVRLSGGFYVLASSGSYKKVRFAKDIARSILQAFGAPMPFSELGKKILEERPLVGHPGAIARNSTRGECFIKVENGKSVALREWYEGKGTE